MHRISTPISRWKAGAGRKNVPSSSALFDRFREKSGRRAGPGRASVQPNIEHQMLQTQGCRAPVDKEERLTGIEEPDLAMASVHAMRMIVLLLLFPCFPAHQQVENADAGSVSGDSDPVFRRQKLIMNRNDVLTTNEKMAGVDEVVKAASSNGLMDAIFSSLSMILVCEIGDETFIIAALMAMRHPRSIVLSGALSALIIMTILSTGLGVIVPNLISQNLINRLATGLYTFFGLRLLYIAWVADAHSTPQKELEEVEEKLEGGPQKNLFRRIFARFCTPIFLESFILTFLAEWGDRSQLATISLAMHKNPFGVTVGAIVGHTMCTSVAVVGGRLLALKISQRTVATVGGCLFLCFAMSSYFYPPL